MNSIKLLFFLLIVSQISFGQHLKIELFNKTGYDLDSISIGTASFIKIKKDSSVIINNCKEITMMGDLPIGTVNGRINEKVHDKRFIGICGTGNKTVHKGHYQFNIIMIDGTNGYRLLYQSHKKTKPSKTDTKVK